MGHCQADPNRVNVFLQTIRESATCAVCDSNQGALFNVLLVVEKPNESTTQVVVDWEY